MSQWVRLLVCALATSGTAAPAAAQVDVISREVSFRTGGVQQIDVVSREVSFRAGPVEGRDVISREWSFNTGGIQAIDVVSREVSFHVLEPGPDLQVPLAGAQIPTGGVTDQPFQVRWTVTNAGTLPAEGVWTDELLFSTPIRLVDGSSTSSTFPVAGPGIIAPGASYERALTFLMPSTASTFDVRIRADVGGSVFEHTETNNELGPVSITVGAPNLRGRITQLPTGAPVAGSTASVSFLVWNDGNGATTVPGWTDRLYMVSADGSVVREVRSFANVSGLMADPGGTGGPVGTSYTRTNESFVLPPDLYGTFHLRLQVDAPYYGHPNGAQPEISETDNVYLSPTTFDVREPDRPNFIVHGGAVQLVGVLPGTPISDGSLRTVSWQLENASSLADFLGGNLRTQIWLSDAPGLGPPDPLASAVLLSSFVESVPPIARGTFDPVPRTRTVVIPSLPGVMGPRYLKVHVNSDGAVPEHNAGIAPYFDNLGVSGGYPITYGGTYDLAPDVSNPISPVGTAQLGHPLEYSWTVRNLGRPDWPVQQSWRDDIWLSQDDQLQPLVDRYVGSFTTSSVQPTPGGGWYLPQNDAYTRTASFLLPTELDPSVRYRLILVTDAGASVSETLLGGESNNLQIGTEFMVLDQPADLTLAAGIGGVQQPPSQGSPGQSVTLAWTVTNVANPATTNVSAWTDRVYLSASSTHLVDERLLCSATHVGALDPGSSYAVSRTATIPNVPPGPRWLHFLADATGLVYEGSATANNREVLPFDVLPGQADLVVEHIAASEVVRSGEAIAVTWRVRNAGTAATLVSSWYDALFLSNSPTLAPGSEIRELGTWPRTSALAADSSYTATRSFAVPLGLAPGAWYVVAWADHGLAVSEVTDFNNTRPTRTLLDLTPPPPGGGGGGGGGTGAGWLPANLVAAEVTPGASIVTAGQELAVAWTVRNDGIAPTSIGNWSDAVSLSTDPFPSADDVPLGYHVHDGMLAQGEARAVGPQSFVVPSGVSGARFVLVRVDAGHGVYQASATADDVAASSVLVSIVPPPPTNLTLTDVTVPTDALMGAGLDVSWTVRNTSSTPIPAEWNWSDGFWIVPEGGTLASSETRYLGSVVSTSGLLRGNTDTQSAPPGALVLPGVLPGDYRVHVRTDVLGQIAETDESLADNLRPSEGVLRVSAIPLSLVPGGTTSATATLPLGASRWFEITATDGQPPAAGATLDFELVHDDPDAGCELYARSGDVPVLGQYDVAADGLQSITPRIQRLRIPRTTGQRVFVLARAVVGVGTTTGATLRATDRQFTVERVQPERIGAGSVTVAIEGAQLWRAAAADSVELRSVDGVSVRRSLETRVLPDGSLLARFGLLGFELGAAELRVFDGTAQADGSALLGVDPPAPLTVEAKLELPGSVRRGESGSALLRIANRGNVDIPFAYAQVGHAHAPASSRAVDRLQLISPAQGAAAVAAGTSTQSVTALIEALGPGRESVLSIQLEVGGQFPSPNAGLAVVARADGRASFLNGVLPLLSESLRSAAALDPETPPQWSALALDPSAWAAATSAAHANGDLMLASQTMEDGSRTARTVRDLLSVIAEGLAAHLGLPPGAHLPESAVRTAYDGLGCALVPQPVLGCEAEYPHTCGEGVSTAEVTAIAGGAHPVGVACVDTPEPTDPDEKIEPPGIGPTRTVRASLPLQYEVRFENVAGATSWASRVAVTDVLAPTFRGTSVRVESIRLGRASFEFPPNTYSYVGQVPLVLDETRTVNCQISALVDVATNTIDLSLQAIDPTTGLPDSAADFGLLPPNDPGFEGMATGSVRFRVSTVEPTPVGVDLTSRSGFQQRNSAETQLNLSPPLHTNTTQNMLDDGAPTSELSVTPLGQSNRFLLSWSASDIEDLAAGEFPGTGTDSFTLWRAPSQGGPWVPIVADTRATSMELVEPLGTTVALKVEARDRVGNRETKDRADVVVQLPADCDQDGKADPEQIAQRPELDLNRNGVLDACECRWERTCLPGSGGATLSVVGMSSIGLNRFGLQAIGARPGVPGMFVYGTAQQQVPLGGGYSCVAGSVVRIRPVSATDSTGSLTQMINFRLPPAGAGPDAIPAGSTRYFQFWYRDTSGSGGIGMNSTDAVAVTFCD